MNKERPLLDGSLRLHRAPFIAGAFLSMAIIGCSAFNTNDEKITNTAPLTPTISESPSSLEIFKIDQQIVEHEVKRLANKYPQDSLIKTVYSGKAPTQLSPIFRHPIEIEFIGLTTYARTYYTDAKFSQQKRFRYFLERDSSLEDYSTLESLKISIAFSSYFLQSENDAVKDLAIEKEAIGLALFEGFSKIALNTYLSQGRIEPIDPNITDQEITRTLGYILLTENPDINKLFDYAAYLPIIQKAGRLIDQNNTDIINELRLSNIYTIYQMAKDRNISFEQITPGSKEFWILAFSPESPWVKMILDPSVPGPRSINQ